MHLNIRLFAKMPKTGQGRASVVQRHVALQESAHPPHQQAALEKCTLPGTAMGKIPRQPVWHSDDSLYCSCGSTANHCKTVPS